MTRVITLKCPYCEANVKHKLEGGTHLVWCLIDEGGCDRRFVVEVNYKVETKTLKIEGEEKL